MCTMLWAGGRPAAAGAAATDRGAVPPLTRG